MRGKAMSAGVNFGEQREKRGKVAHADNRTSGLIRASRRGLSTSCWHEGQQCRCPDTLRPYRLPVRTGSAAHERGTVVNLRVEVRKRLWGNAGNRCAFTACEQRLVSDLGYPDQSLRRDVVIGEEAHIRSSKANGPRHDPLFPSAQLNEYDNLILLCPTHHALIDKDKGRAWPTVEVVGMKSVHEARVDAAMSGAARDRQQLEVALAERVDRWESSIELDKWEELTRRLNWIHPYISNIQLLSLTQTAIWLAGIEWPSQYPKLSAAFETHGAVLDVLIKHITSSFVPDGDTNSIRRRHKETWYGGNDGEQQYTKAISEFGVDAAVTGVLINELTRSVNLVVTAVNDELLPLYRINDGRVQMIEGDLLWGLWSSHPHYEPLTWESFPRNYDLGEIKRRVKIELHGGDPRNGRTMEAASFDPSIPSGTGTKPTVEMRAPLENVDPHALRTAMDTTGN